MSERQNKPTLNIDRAPDGAYVIRALTSNGVVSLGTHPTLAEAWKAVDSIDCGIPLAQAA